MTALQAKSCSPRPWVHRVTALFRSRIMQILIPFRSHLRVAGHEISKVFTANKSFCHHEGTRKRESDRGKERAGEHECLKKNRKGSLIVCGLPE